MSADQKISVKAAKYIKLGKAGSWEELCLKDGTLRLGYYEVPHQFGLENNRDAIKKFYLANGYASSVATGHARQVLDFYRATAETIWITFCDGYLWWCMTDSEVEYFGANAEAYPNGSRLRKSVSGWKNTSIAGCSLLISELSGQLTRVQSYQQAICDIKGSAFEYLVRKINGEKIPEIEAAIASRSSMETTCLDLIRKLTWQDFELFTELIFSGSGWQRVSELGGAQKTIDLELVQPLSDDRCVVQIKSRTDQKEFDRYSHLLPSYNAESSFYVYHTSTKPIKTNGSQIQILGPVKLSVLAVRLGLVDWLIKKVG